MRQTYVAPQNETERKIAAIWQEVLRQERVGARDNFFEIGGDSLKAVQLKSKLEETFETEIPVVALFEHMTIQSFANYLEENDRENEEKPKLDRGEAIARARDDRSRQRNKRRIKREG
jgi:tyrocidine synthetase-3